jgi:Uncharacterized conserved protein
MIKLFLQAVIVALGAATASAQAPKVTASEIVARIRERAGIAAPDNTVDTFKAGDPNTAVTGIAVTMMSTLDVLKEASRRGLNFVITHEPTFYNHRDTTAILEGENDAVLAAKEKFIKDHGLVIWRFHDTPHMMSPDMIRTGMVRALGWKQSDSSKIYQIEPPLAARSLFLGARLNAKAIRISGEPSAKISRVAFTQGFSGFAGNRHAIQQNVDALVMGEDYEWESIEYAKDALTEGRIKVLIVLGHVPSEQEGMREVTRWLGTFVKDVPVQFVPTPDPFSPAKN